MGHRLPPEDRPGGGSAAGGDAGRSRPEPFVPHGLRSLAPALDTAKADAADHGAPLTLICLTAEQKTQLEEEFHGRFTFQEDRDGFDYLYTVDKLADLAGKKLHAKRNHIHRFDEQFPDWLFEPIGPDNLAECVEMEAKWYAAAVGGRPGGR